jgi:hypothetical protein
MNLNRLLNTPMGVVFISMILGLGLATLFRKVCKDKNCIVFNGPIISDFDNKTYQYGNKCFQYTTNQANCDKTKKIIDVTGPTQIDPVAQIEGTDNAILSGASPVSSSSSPSLFNVFGK